MNLLDYLKQQPRARERKNKNQAIGNILMKKYSVDYDLGVFNVTKSELADIVGEVLTLDRQWRKILEENPNLRGTDYKDKSRLEEEKLIELGYDNITP